MGHQDQDHLDAPWYWLTKFHLWPTGSSKTLYRKLVRILRRYARTKKARKSDTGGVFFIGLFRILCFREAILFMRMAPAGCRFMGKNLQTKVLSSSTPKRDCWAWRIQDRIPTVVSFLLQYRQKRLVEFGLYDSFGVCLSLCFICKETSWLDNKHVIFGEVIDGMAVVRKMEALGTKHGTPKHGFTVKIKDCGLLD